MSVLNKLRSATKNEYFKILVLSGLTILVGFVTNLLMPIKIGVGVYGDYRYLYTIIGFSGMFHLGYLDGFYLVSLSKSEAGKVSIGYLTILVFIVFILAFLGMQIFGMGFKIPILLLFAVFLVSNYVNLLGINNNVNKSFLIPIAIQVLVAVIVLASIHNSFLIQLFVANINACILGLLVIQLLMLLVWKGKQVNFDSIQFSISSSQEIWLYHKKGIKTLVIGLTIITIMGIDKIVLKRYLVKEQYGIYCFSNSFLISLLGLSLSVSNKFISELYQTTISGFKSKYNLLVRNISFLSIVLIVFSFLLFKSGWLEGSRYANFLVYLTPTFGLFSYLFIIQLLHSNMVKVYNIEKEFVLFHVIVVGILAILLSQLNQNIAQLLFYCSALFFLAVVIFDIVFIKKKSGFGMSYSNMVVAAMPLVTEMLILVFN